MYVYLIKNDQASQLIKNQLMKTTAYAYSISDHLNMVVFVPLSVFLETIWSHIVSAL